MPLNWKEACLWVTGGSAGKYVLFLYNSVCQVVSLHSVVYWALFVFFFPPCSFATEVCVSFKILEFRFYHKFSGVMELLVGDSAPLWATQHLLSPSLWLQKL